MTDTSRASEDIYVQTPSRLSGSSFGSQSLDAEIHSQGKNDSAQSYPRERCLHQLIEEQVLRSPDAPVLVCAEEELTYRQINERANQLAHRLRELGVGSQSLVGICMRRSPELLIGLLAILKAGGAYVPIDPAYPAQRVAFMLSDARLSLLLTQQALLEQMPKEPAIRYLCLDAGSPELMLLASYPQINPEVSMHSEELAYVIYTSGSTGQPKGVQISHRSLLNLLFWHNRIYSITASDRATQLASIAFDACVWEIWPYLLAGACLFFPDEEVRLAPRLLRDWLLEQRITYSFLPTPLAEGMLTLPWPDEVPLRALLTGGDRLRHYPDARLPFPLVNHYGPTEFTVVATAGPVPVAGTDQEGDPDIGRPIDNTQAYVLDENLQAVAPGEVGELYVGGASLARGYLNRPALTAERFVPDPFASVPGSRLYRTGDLVYQRNDGTLAYIGRVDQQVKIRGFRIELGEIEAVLAQAPGVKESLVLARENLPGQKELVAYLVPTAEPSPAFSLPEVRLWMQDRLPDYMLPAAFVLLERFPLTTNGKIDRQALPAPHKNREMLGTPAVAPRTELERALAAIWEEVLELPEVGVEDNFFTLGGHSLQATQIVARVASSLQADLPLRSLFATPTIAALAVQLQSQETAYSTPAFPPLRLASRDGDLPLSFAQQRLWFLDRLDPGQATYTYPMAWHLRGPLQVQALHRSLLSLLTRHEALRTTFVLHHEQPVQHIASPSLDLLCSHLEPTPHETIQQAIARFLRTESQRPFDLACGPLMRAHLLEIEPGWTVLLLVLHHTIIDGWSLPLLIREISLGYQAALRGESAALPALPVQYSDYALWQQDWLHSPAAEEQLAYWKAHLAYTPPLLALPTDRPRPAVQRFQGAVLDFHLPASWLQAVQTFSQREEVTLFMTLLAGFQVLLARYTGSRDISVGSPIANRRLPELESLIGFFVNTLVMRTDLSGEPSFRQVVARVREVALGAYGHQDVPFERVVEALQPQRDLSYSPLFQVLFALQPPSSEHLHLEGLETEETPISGETSMFDLSWSVQQRDDHLEVQIEYNRDLFDPETIQRLMEGYQHLFSQMLQAPDQPVWSLPFLTQKERRQIGRWNETEQDYPGPHCLHELIEAQVQRTPDGLALIADSDRLSYAELNQRANRLAHLLQQRGVGPDVLVGVCLPRSIDLVVSLLAILKAGGAYVPLDPSYPQQRLASMIQQANLPLLLTQRPLRSHLPSCEGQIICLDDEPALALQPDTNPSSSVTPEHLAYVIYTSGSTGTPKGVMNAHRGICNRLLWGQHTFALSPQDRVLQKTPMSFDVSVWELFWPLLTGASLVLARPEGHKDSAYLLQLIQQEQITTLHFVPSMLALFLNEPAISSCTSLRQVFCSGEALPFSLQERFFHLHPAQLHNLYGPTEAAVEVTSWTCRHEEEHQVVPIGSPLANIQIHLLDPAGQPVPVGVAAELYIGGLAVARGYLNEPALTAEGFVPDPWSTRPGSRLYRTGDLARYRPDGSIEFLGRLDGQVKIRGCRIEMGEIETALKAHPGIGECVVVASESAAGQPALLAYLVPTASGEDPLEISAVRRWLQTRLPDYMLPEAFVVLETLPLNHNGKVDRRALPLPRYEHDALREPRNETERVLATVWASVLHLPRVGIHDNFFLLGGHSLLAVQLVARICHVFQIDLPIRALFEHPTIAALATQVQSQETLHTTPAFPPLHRASRDGDLPLSFAQQRLWFLDRLDPGQTTYTYPMAWHLRGPLQVQALHRSLLSLLTRHEALRTTFVLHHEQPVQHIASPSLDLPRSRLVPTPHETIQQAIARFLRTESQRPFDLACGPLMRAHLLEIVPGWTVLLLVLHHTIIDGWSLPLLIREISLGYQAALRGESAALPALPVQYADYALWQQDWLHSPAAEEQLAYWKAHLADAPPLLALPTDRPRPAVQRFQGAVLNFHLPASWLQAVQTFSQREEVTLFMTLLAGFQVLLARYTGSRDISVGSPIANRRMPQLERLIGFFVNTLVMRTDLSGEPSFRQVVARVREVALGAYGHQDVPFERVVEALQPQRDLSYSPLFQVLFALQPPSSEHLHLEGLETEEMPISGETSMFDLSWSVQQTETGLEGLVEFNCDLFDPETVERMIEQYGLLLQRLVQEPEEAVWNVPLLSEGERRQIGRWNETEQDYPGPHCLHELIEAQVQRTPDGLALIAASERLSYAELNQRANRLAHLLQQRGVGPDVLVGVCLPRSLDLVVSLLAILKAGGAYVPLDPNYPQQRLASMIQQAHPPLLLTQRPLRSHLPSCEGQVICLDDEPALAQQPDTNPCSSVTPEHLAYVIYTSGSTGTPKGVMNSHRGICNRLLWGQHTFALSPQDRVLQKTPMSFDVSVWELFWPLLTGASLVLARPEGHKDSAYLLQLIQQEQITTLHFVPSMLALFLNEPAISACTSLRQIFCSGEALPFSLQERFFHLHPAQLHNLYGPTEAAVEVTFWTCRHEEERQVVPIGSPLANIQIHLLDPAGQPVPVGVAAELFIGGLAVARGYLNEPALTAEGFVPDPWSTRPGSRLYRTGDLARYRPDGSIEFLGRLDGQVKIRGCRIEIGEIETALKAHPSIGECVVVASESAAGQPALLAYLVPTASGEDPLEISAVRRWLQTRLPDYMLPEAFVVLETLPLNHNGKVDRRALPPPRYEHDAVSDPLSEPRTETERVLATVWASVLHLPRVGIHDNFFLLGGHSLLAVQLVARLRHVFQTDLPIRALFEYPTIAELTRYVQSHQTDRTLPSLPEFQPGVRPQHIPLALAQQRFWFLDRLDPGNPAYNVPLVLRINGPLLPEYCQKALYFLAQRHETLRTTVITTKGKPVQQIAAQPHVPFLQLDLSELSAESREQDAMRALEEEVARPFKLTTGPLIRAMLLRLSESEHLLVITMHHTITDGWSFDILFQEFCLAYNALVADKPIDLPDLPIQYADFAIWQQKWQEQGLMDLQLDYWKRQLANLPEIVLPLDGPQPVQSTAPLAASMVRLSPVLRDALYQLNQREGVTPFMTLLALFQMLLGSWIGQDDIAVGTLVANRTQVEVEALVGCFMNTLVLRTSLAGNPPFRELLRRVQETALGAYVHQDTPFDAIVNALRSPQQRTQRPLYSTMFALHTMPQEIAPTLAGLDLTPVNLRSKTARTDLMLSLSEVQGEINGALEYNADLFAESTMVRLARYYTRLVEVACAQPESTLQDLLLLAGIVARIEA